MVTTSNREWWSAMWSFKDHGKSWEAVYCRGHQPGFRWLHESFGTNWRMLEVQAAIGRQQLKWMPVWTQRRQENAARIAEACAPFPSLRVPAVPSHMTHACYKFYAFVRPKELTVGWSRDRIIEEVNERGVPCFQGSCSEVYLEKAFDGTGMRPAERLPVAKELGETSLMFLVHPTLTDGEIAKTCRVLSEVMSRATR